MENYNDNEDDDDDDDFYWDPDHLPKNYRLKFSGGLTSWHEREPLKTWFPYRKRTGWRGPRKAYKKVSNLEKARRRSIKALGAVFARLLKKPKGFMTLIFDRAVKEWELDECLNCFERFRRYLERSFPKCWFIFVMEWSPRSGFHYHLSGRIGEKTVPLDAIRQKWLSITGSTDRESIHFKNYDPIHFFYVTKKEKAQYTRYLMKKLGRRSFWGCIHRKLMPLAPEEYIDLDEDQMDMYRVSMRDQIIENGGAESSIHRLMTPANRLNYETREMREKALEFALRPIEDEPEIFMRKKAAERFIARHQKK